MNHNNGMKLIERNLYLNRLKDLVDTPDIKVITGIRRSGKSKLLDSFAHYLSLDPKKNIIRINLNLKSCETLLDKEKLYDFVEKSYHDNKTNYLFIDEVQMCDGFERIINSLHEEGKFDIYLTGSNAFLLSSDLATLFGGRVFELKIYPFSFQEYCAYFEPNDLEKAFDEYVYRGGMSGSYLYRNQTDALNYVKEIYDTAIKKDIVNKYKIENENLLTMLGDYLMDMVGCKTSIRNLSHQLTAKTYKTNDKTVGSYLGYLCKSFLFYPFQRYDIKGKRYLESEKKYYLADLSFRFAEIGTKNADYGHLYENLVAIELLRRGYEVYVGCLYDKEIDFVAIKNGQKTYIQVSDDITKKETFQRETSSLLSIKDAYPKLLIARTKHDESQYEGIRIIDLAMWLSGSQKQDLF